MSQQTFLGTQRRRQNAELHPRKIGSVLASCLLSLAHMFEHNSNQQIYTSPDGTGVQRFHSTLSCYCSSYTCSCAVYISHYFPPLLQYCIVGLDRTVNSIHLCMYVLAMYYIAMNNTSIMKCQPPLHVYCFLLLIELISMPVEDFPVDSSYPSRQVVFHNSLCVGM